MMRGERWWPVVMGVLAAAWLAPACGELARPAELDTAGESCASCRMAVSSVRTAGQIAAPGAEPLFFDDLGCLRDYLTAGRPVARSAAAYVADHRTGEWILARSAVYAEVPSLATPMGSHLVAHASAASRERDQLGPATARTVEQVFGETLALQFDLDPDRTP